MRNILNQFEIFVSSLIYERTLTTVLLCNKTVLRENHVNIEIMSRISQFGYTDVVSMKLLAVVTSPSIYRGCSAQKTFWEDNFSPVNMKTLVIVML